MKSIAVTGYKNFELGIFKKDADEAIYIKETIKRHLIPLVEDGLEWVIISGQLGIELWAGEVVAELKAEGYELKLAVLEPFEKQSTNWNEANQLWVEEILAAADYHAFITKRPYENPAQFAAKDGFIIDNTDGALLVYDLEKEGSPKFFYERAKIAKEQSTYYLECIDFYALQDVVDDMNQAF
ncbi:DUF1273 domain-containing protein [Listeria seeligeri]|uniref:DUF1273 domain-containing protein n=1 Tax=Listeria seeligeri TaxID=1640 RepID=UPI001629D9F8|nr:DUF1273 domain-containing protein [Listeria seeligeri]MBC1754545.1 DUF1273 domain-containing protein [Listeria seeligeri]MBC1788248.1 DUF1273 domain-containing protein [Listeria seeligeri]MBC1822875.1 DUF1273 domain-containing protein [Listeria seeligeri]MBC1836926.1 DUF1273 domain-containing protein [Listeria seeligeri]MBC2235272.1 DUF1273 domain-containing protein [Listeria seeligeri]